MTIVLLLISIPIVMKMTWVVCATYGAAQQVLKTRNFGSNYCKPQKLQVPQSHGGKKAITCCQNMHW